MAEFSSTRRGTVMATHMAPVPVPSGIGVPDEVRTRLGTLRFFDGFPDDATTRMLFDNLDFQRAVRGYLPGLAPVDAAAMRTALLRWGPPNTTMAIWEDWYTQGSSASCTTRAPRIAICGSTSTADHGVLRPHRPDNTLAPRVRDNARTRRSLRRSGARSCRTGVCHTRETALVTGRVDYSPEPVEPPAQGCALICCSTPTADIVLDM